MCGGDGSYKALNTSFGRVQREHVLAPADTDWSFIDNRVLQNCITKGFRSILT